MNYIVLIVSYVWIWTEYYNNTVSRWQKKKEKIKIYEKFKLKNEIFFFQSFTWNLGRPVDEVEVLQLSVISRGVLKNEKVLAKYGLVLQTVVREGRIDITDFLVDLNNKPLPVSWNNAHDNEFPCSIPYRAIWIYKATLDIC